MAGETKIEWADRTWNPTRGCTPISPGCAHCYAMKFAYRFNGVGEPYEGLTRIGNTGAVWTGEVREVPFALDVPLHWRKPSRIFVDSMSDLFHQGVPFGFIEKVFAVMANCPQHTFQILTKRAARMEKVVTQLGRDFAVNLRATAHGLHLNDSFALPLPNVWLGVSVEDQQRVNERIPHLLKTPAAVRFLSCEPLLEEIDLDPYLNRCSRIHWVIVGGESGLGARPMSLQWPLSIVESCRMTGTKVFVKQLGARPIDGGDRLVQLKSRKGGDPSEWPGKPGAWPREFPEALR